jgi:hypothetical protein
MNTDKSEPVKNICTRFFDLTLIHLDVREISDYLDRKIRQEGINSVKTEENVPAAFGQNTISCLVLRQWPQQLLLIQQDILVQTMNLIFPTLKVNKFNAKV